MNSVLKVLLAPAVLSDPKKNETRIITDQIILNSFLVFSQMMKGDSKDIKVFLSEHEANAKRLCENYGETYAAVFSLVISLPSRILNQPLWVSRNG